MGGSLLSFTKCINKCRQPRPVLKILVKVTITDSEGGEAHLSLKDEHACIAFDINYKNSDIFKEYFFQHGVFFYKSAKKTLSKEYMQVIEFFKRANTQEYFTVEAVPFCRVGYDD